MGMTVNGSIATVSCTPHSVAHGQARWNGYVITVNPEAQRTKRTVKLLRVLGIHVKTFLAIPAYSDDEVAKVRSNLLTQRAIYDAIARGHGQIDEYVFLFEDDILRAPNVPATDVQSLLSCGAYYSRKRQLPLFYAGACAPRFVNNEPIWDGHPATPTQLKVATRVFARCAHAYAVRRRDAPMLRALADAHPNRGVGVMGGVSAANRSWYMDLQIESLARAQGGFYLVAPGGVAPAEQTLWWTARGIFYQDRVAFPSGIKPIDSRIAPRQKRWNAEPNNSSSSW